MIQYDTIVSSGLFESLGVIMWMAKGL